MGVNGDGPAVGDKAKSEEKVSEEHGKEATLGVMGGRCGLMVEVKTAKDGAEKHADAFKG